MTAEILRNAPLMKFTDSLPKMETLVLIPQEFALVVTPGVSRGRGIPELTASVWTTAHVPRGALCYPFQGTIRIDKLEVYSYVADDDVSTIIISCLCRTYTIHKE